MDPGEDATPSGEARDPRRETRARRVPWLAIFVEGVTIVVSILLAFGIDRWWDERDREEREAVLLQGLLEDLRQDSLDYLEFAEQNRKRVLAAGLVLAMAEGSGPLPGSAGDGAGEEVTSQEAFPLLGIPTRLETVFVSYEELTATGGSSVVVDPVLRRRLATYYALARDRADINASMEPGVQRFYARLETLGHSPTEGGRLLVPEVLHDPAIRAQIQNMGSIAVRAEGYGRELLDLATILIQDVEDHLKKGR